VTPSARRFIGTPEGVPFRLDRFVGLFGTPEGVPFRLDRFVGLFGTLEGVPFRLDPFVVLLVRLKLFKGWRNVVRGSSRHRSYHSPALSRQCSNRSILASGRPRGREKSYRNAPGLVGREISLSG